MEAIKKRLNSLYFGLKRSLKHDHEGQISKLTSVLQTFKILMRHKVRVLHLP